VSPSGCVHVGHGQQKVCYKCGWDCYVTSTTREKGGGRLLQVFCLRSERILRIAGSAIVPIGPKSTMRANP
jgi:hypothetical protein